MDSAPDRMPRKPRRVWLLIAALLALGLAGALHLISKARCFQLVGDLVCRVETSEKVVALTFDDGPTPEGTDAVLAVLARYEIKATFFLIGNKMERFPGQAERLLAAGHELGNHTYSHERNLLRTSAFYRSEVGKADRLLRLAGARPTLFRPPFGKRLIGLPLAADAAGYQTVMWEVEDQPEKFRDPQAYARDIVSRVRPGSIILMHPMYRHSQTARDALPLVIEQLRERGYTITTVSDLIGRAPEMSDHQAR